MDILCGSQNPMDVYRRRIDAKASGLAMLVFCGTTGGFDYLFNVCKPADDPINQGRVPDGFEPIICGDIREIETMHKRGCDICSASVSKIEISMGGAAEYPFLLGGGGGFEFKCSREKGAILVLPDGGASYGALDISQCRSYAAQHAHAWYQFANITCGREALNGSLYLVTGSGTCSFSLKFLVGGVAEGNIKLGYSWKSTSSADVRAYPDGEFAYLVDSLRPNQCVFLRGFGISIRTSAFARWVFGPTEVSQISESSKDQMPYFDNGMPYSGSRRKRTRSGSLSMYSGIPFHSSRKRFKKEDLLSEPVPVSPPPMTRVLPPNHYASSPPIFPGWGADYHDEPSLKTELLNPCAKINEFILETHLHVNVAITHSGEWLSALSQGDDSDVIVRVLSDYKVIIHDGVAMLEAQ
ncbi:uncharacterized protein EV420DRAFT_1698300 [Desarmillaria tabescens]|uniref:Uncharacterized protein n=1 Tax=Armillaria tabescens TaxID=1929756 RepID=A0AA39NJN9_ARMTA|nr:uncharacterized protein EV420DRAFT_1698300 [Desarmillaria tabescens]KAK0466718.1 hypothetical protein EV420DRAFT_1698300 [Desarmillaria tabescens]